MLALIFSVSYHKNQLGDFRFAVNDSLLIAPGIYFCDIYESLVYSSSARLTAFNKYVLY